MKMCNSSERVKKLEKIAETGLGSYISSAIAGFFVGALPRQRDDFNFFTPSQPWGGMSAVEPVLHRL